MSGGIVEEPEDESRAATSQVRRLTWGGVAWLFVLVAIGIVQVVRHQWMDAAIFGAAAVLLAADAAGLFPRGRPRPRPRTRLLLGASAAALVILSFVPRHGVVAAITMVAVGVGAVAAAWAPTADTEPHRAWPRALRRLAWAWAVIWIVGCVWELIEFILGGLSPQARAGFPALSDLLDPLVNPGLGQAIFAAAWLAVGVFLVSRGSRR